MGNKNIFEGAKFGDKYIGDSVLCGNQYYLFDDNDYDRWFQQILLSNPNLTVENTEELCTVFIDNILDFFDMFPFDENTDFSEVISGFRKYIEYIKTL